MQYLGDYRIDDYITFGAQLHRFSSGAVYAPTGNATYTFYENNSTSGAPTGGNLGQLNSKTGLYTARVQLTAAAGFEAGKEYLIHIEATVDSVAAAELLMFRIIANPKVDVDTIKTQAVTCAAGVTVLASVGTAATSTAQTGDSYARLGAPTGASVSADIAAVKGETAAILDDTDDIGIAGAGLTALGDTRLANLDATISSRGTSTYAGADTSGTTTLLGRIVGTLAAGTHNPQSGDAYASVAALNNLSSAQAQSAATAALNAYDPPTNAEMEARTLVAANYATAAALDAVDNYIDTEIAAIKAVTDKLDTTLEADGEVYRFTVSALENAPAGGGGGTDWSVSEREQIRYRLQLDGTQTAPADTDLPAVNVTNLAAAALQQIRDALKLAASGGAAAVGSVDASLASILEDTGTTLPATLAGLATSLELAAAVVPLALEATAQSILEDTGTTLPATLDQMMDNGTAVFDRATDSLQAIRDRGDVAWTAAAGGLYSETITVQDGDGTPLDGAFIQMATDSAFSNVIRSGYTNDLGQWVFQVDATGTYYGRAELAGKNVGTFTVVIA